MPPDPQIDVESLIKESVEAIKRGADLDVVLKNVADTAAKLGLNIEDLKNGLISAGVSAQKVTEIFAKFGEYVTKLSDIFEELKNSADISGFLEKNGNLFGTLIRAIIPPSKELTATLEKYKQSSATFGVSLGETASSISEYSKLLNSLPGGGALTGLLGGLVNIGAGADQAKKLENTFLGISASAGDLGGNLRDTLGASFENLDAKMEEFNIMVGRVGTATGTSANEAMQYALQLKQIPGAMDETISVSKDSAGSLDALTAIIKVSRGTMQETGAVIATINELFKTLGTNTDGSLKAVARMYDVSQNIKMPTDMMKTYVMGAAAAFKFLGDNTQGAMNIMEKMGGTLRDAGMGPQAVQEIVSGYLKGIEQMGVAQKAFISGRTGGPGGLRGGFELEYMLKEGKGEDVAEKVNQAMKSMFGGRIVNLEEAAKSNTAAAQMVKQVELLKSFGLAGDKDQAYGIIEALKEGRELPAEKTPEQALEKAVQDGNSITERQDTKLTEIINQLQVANTSASIRTAATLRMVMGSESKLATSISEARTEAVNRALSIGKGFSASPGAGKTGLAEGTEYMLGNIAVISGSIGKAMSEALNAPKPVSGTQDRQAESAMGLAMIPETASEPPNATATTRKTITTAAARKAEEERVSAASVRLPKEPGTSGAIHVHIKAELGKDVELMIDRKTGELIKSHELGKSTMGSTGH